MFGSREREDQQYQELLVKLEELGRDVAALRGEKSALRKERNLHDEVVRLKEEVEDLRIQKGRLTEDHQREKRDVEHMVGLEKKRQEFELVAAKRDAELSVREENLQADLKRFSEQTDFVSKRFTEEVGYLKGMFGEVLARLPNVDVNKTIEITEGRRRASGQ